MPTRRAFLGTSFGSLATTALPLSLLDQAFAAPPPKFDLLGFERRRILAPAAALLKEAPITVTASSSPRSAGGRHDYFSEADYKWPKPGRPRAPYATRDGHTNPANFNGHRKAMRRLSVQMPALTAAWLVTGKREYADHAVRHLTAWFVDPSTMMTPHLLYSQAEGNRSTGERIGIVDGIHLVEVVRAATVLEQTGGIDKQTANRVKRWFAAFLTWLLTHKFGIEERDSTNNHATCWVMQAAEYARYTGNTAVTRLCINRFKKWLLRQIASDGSIPREMARTRPYSYSLFNVELLATVCQILSTPADNLWTYQFKDNRGAQSMPLALAFLYPYVLDKRKWPKGPDITYWNEWPIRHIFLLFGGLALDRPEYVALWKTLNGDPKSDEAIRNFPIRQPVLWYPIAKTRA